MIGEFKKKNLYIYQEKKSYTCIIQQRVNYYIYVI